MKAEWNKYLVLSLIAILLWGNSGCKTREIYQVRADDGTLETEEIFIGKSRGTGYWNGKRITKTYFRDGNLKSESVALGKIDGYCGLFKTIESREWNGSGKLVKETINRPVSWPGKHDRSIRWGKRDSESFR